MWSNPVISIALYMILYAVGKVIAKKTKGIIVEGLFLSVVYIAGFLTGAFPTDTLTNTGVPAMMSAFGTMLLVTNLGTMIELSRLLKEWKTVVICLCGLLVMGILFSTLGIVVFNRYYALSALPPVAGGIVAAGLVADAAEAAGMTHYGAFASLVCSLQTFAAVPVASYLLRRHCDKLVADKSYLAAAGEHAGGGLPDLRIIKSFPRLWNDGSMMTARVLLVTLMGVYLSKATGGRFPAAVAVLFLGVLFTELGLLERQSLAKAGWVNILIMGMVMSLPNSFRNLTLDSFGAMLVPVVFFLVLGVAGLVIGGVIMGRILKIDWKLAASSSLAAMYGYPLTEIIPRAVVGSYDLPADEEEQLLEQVMPPLIIAGFTTVTIASVALAGFVAPIIFQ